MAKGKGQETDVLEISEPHKSAEQELIDKLCWFGCRSVKDGFSLDSEPAQIAHAVLNNPAHQITIALNNEEDNLHRLTLAGFGYSPYKNVPIDEDGTDKAKKNTEFIYFLTQYNNPISTIYMRAREKWVKGLMDKDMAHEHYIPVRDYFEWRLKQAGIPVPEPMLSILTEHERRAKWDKPLTESERKTFLRVLMLYISKSTDNPFSPTSCWPGKDIAYESTFCGLLKDARDLYEKERPSQFKQYKSNCDKYGFGDIAGAVMLYTLAKHHADFNYSDGKSTPRSEASIKTIGKLVFDETGINLKPKDIYDRLTDAKEILRPSDGCK